MDINLESKLLTKNNFEVFVSTVFLWRKKKLLSFSRFHTQVFKIFQKEVVFFFSKKKKKPKFKATIYRKTQQMFLKNFVVTFPLIA